MIAREVVTEFVQAAVRTGRIRRPLEKSAGAMSGVEGRAIARLSFSA
jgi:hypothetical protein